MSKMWKNSKSFKILIQMYTYNNLQIFVWNYVLPKSNTDDIKPQTHILKTGNSHSFILCYACDPY